jgi:outer membrane protein OmpA-like peptidoglycan-associated protein
LHIIGTLHQIAGYTAMGTLCLSVAPAKKPEGIHMRRFLKSTTGMTLVFAMTLPHIAVAQDVCGTGTFPCVTENGTTVETTEELQALVDGQAEAVAAAAQAEAEAAAAAQADADAAAAAQADADAAAQADADAAAAAQAETDAAAAAQADADTAATAQAETDAAAATQADADAAAAAQAETDAAAAEAAQAEADAAAAAQAETDAAAAEAAQAEADAAAAAQVETDAAATAQAETDAVAAEAAQAEAEAAEAAQSENDAAAAKAEADAAAAAQAEADAVTADTPASDESVAAEAPVDEAETQQSDATPAATEEAAQEAVDPQEQALRDQIRAELLAERAAEQANSQAATATEEAGAEVQVETETLTEEDVRSSDQEFATSVTGAQTEESGRSGLSKFETALILGLGAVVVGNVLKNGDEVRSRSGDRVVVERDGELRVLKDDDALLRRAGNDIRTETFDDGSSRTIVEKTDGTRVVTIRGADGTVLRRLRVMPDGQEFTLFDDTQVEREIVVSQLPQARSFSQMASAAGDAELRAALEAQAVAGQGAAFSLRQVRDITQVRALAPQIELDAVRFATGSAAIQPEQARSLARIGNSLREIIANDPRTVLLVEGHTDAVGDATYNLALSDRRAETVALALTEYFGVPEENMIVQGYGESQLKVPTQTAEQANRRAVVRNITQLLR